MGLFDDTDTETNSKAKWGAIIGAVVGMFSGEGGIANMIMGLVVGTLIGAAIDQFGGGDGKTSGLFGSIKRMVSGEKAPERTQEVARTQSTAPAYPPAEPIIRADVTPNMPQRPLQRH